MTKSQMLNWYCCSCLYSKNSYEKQQLSANERGAIRKRYNQSVESMNITLPKKGKDGGTYDSPTLIVFDPYDFCGYKPDISTARGHKFPQKGYDSSELMSRLQELTEFRLNNRGLSSPLPPRVVSIDWVVHVIQLGEFIDFDASCYFNLPSENVDHNPIVFKDENDRYIIDDVVYYSTKLDENSTNSVTN
jgi:hypothetical protein